jgi:anti-sigma factor ChrR (cupin superfamily)
MSRLLNAVRFMFFGEEILMAKLDGLIAEVEEVKGTVASAIALIAGLKEQIENAGTDQAALDEIVAQLDAQQQALAAAVAANPDEPT